MPHSTTHSHRLGRRAFSAAAIFLMLAASWLIMTAYRYTRSLPGSQELQHQAHAFAADVNARFDDLEAVASTSAGGAPIAMAQRHRDLQDLFQRRRSLIRNGATARAYFDAQSTAYDLLHLQDQLIASSDRDQHIALRDVPEYAQARQRLTERLDAFVAAHVQLAAGRRSATILFGLMIGIVVCGAVLWAVGARAIRDTETSQSALVESESRYRTIVEHAALGIVHADAGGQILVANSTLASMLGYASTAELQACNMRELYAEPDGHAEAIATASRDAMCAERLTWKRKDGSQIQVRLAGRLVRDSAAGAPLEVHATVEDVTHRLELEEQLRQSQKMEAIGRLAGGIAHDFNNLLTVILGNVELLRIQRLGASPELDEVGRAGASAASITRQLLAFSRHHVTAAEVFDLNDAIRGVHRMLRHVLGADIQPVMELDPGVGTIRVDRAQFEQAIVNLAVNARDAMPKGGELLIRTVRQQGGEAATIVVRDTGDGMDAYTRSHIFEPFFTTKGPGRGTGLGLSLVYGFVTQAGGQISVDSEPGEGTTFTLMFPSHVMPRHTAASSPSLVIAGRGEGVLVVDDEASIRTLLEAALCRHGYRVSVAASASEALDVIAQDRFDLLLTDVVMPGGSGVELAKRILLDHNGDCPKVLFMSGYADHAIFADSPFADMPLVPKPFQPSDLLKRVREILDSEQNLGSVA